MQKIKSFGVISVAKTSTIIGVLFGVLTIPISLVTARTSGTGVSGLPWEVLSPFHLFLIVGTAAVLGFVYGVVGTLAYNLVARWTGGIEVEL
jgi:hypothetical protein